MVALKQIGIWLQDMSLMWRLLGRNLWLVLWISPDSSNGSFYKNRWVLEIPSRTAVFTRREAFHRDLQCTEIFAAQKDWQASVVFRVTKAVCINPLAVIASHLIDIPLVCFSLKTSFGWVFWKTLHYQFSAGKASFCSSYFQELMLVTWSPVPPSALPCSAAALLDSHSALCSHSRGCGCAVLYVARTSELYCVTGKPDVGKQRSQFVL